jgi:hypothetical protein
MNMVLFEHCKEIENGSETKEKVLNKSKSLVKIFEVVFLCVPSCKVNIFDVYKKLI